MAAMALAPLQLPQLPHPRARRPRPALRLSESNPIESDRQPSGHARWANGAPSRRASARTMIRCQSSETQVKKAEPETKKEERGWLYKVLVEPQTMASKLQKLKDESAARKGLIDTWFGNAFKYTAWLEVHGALTERRLPSVTPAEALQKTKGIFNKAVILDVREKEDYDALRAEMACNAPLFRLIQGNDVKANVRRFGYALLTDFAGTERNPDFVQQAEAAVKGNKNKTLLVMCGRGGTLETFIERKGPKAKKFQDPERMFGIPSRSLKACYELQEAGFKKVIHVKGGMNQWKYEGLPIAEGTE